MNVFAIEPFYSGSHKAWIDQLKSFTSLNIQLFTLPGKHWKWRMEGSAIHFAETLNKLDKPDGILVTDMFNLALFKSLYTFKDVPIILYMHENQLSYPWSPNDPDLILKRDVHYGFINYTSCLCADQIVFNSAYHQTSFISACRKMLRALPDKKHADLVNKIDAKSSVIPLGFDFKFMDECKVESKNDVPIILWNHRWEYDKQPETFFETLYQLKKEKHKFKLIVLGEHTQTTPPIFGRINDMFQEELLHFGFAPSKEEYYRWLWLSDILPVCNIQDFFGISIIEAVYCDCLALLPQQLAYPEHFDPAQFPDVYYDEGRPFKEALKMHISDYKSLPKLKESIKKYNWSQVINLMDNCLISTFGS